MEYLYTDLDSFVEKQNAQGPSDLLGMLGGDGEFEENGDEMEILKKLISGVGQDGANAGGGSLGINALLNAAR